MSSNYIRFDWAMKRLLRNKANFAVLEGFLTTLFREKKCFGARFWRDSGHKYKKSKYKFGFYKIFYFRWDCARILILNVLS